MTKEEVFLKIQDILLVIQKIPVRLFSLFVIGFALIILITGTSKKSKTKDVSFFLNFALLLGLGVLCLIINSAIILKLYPLLINILFLTTFGRTLFSPPSMIFRFALMQDKTLRGSLNEKRIADYCRKVTYVWCGFFIINGSIAAWTIFSGSNMFWFLYNGGIAYILMGAIFVVEFIVRKIVQKKMPKSVALSMFKNNSRPRSTILCYEGAWSDSAYKTWGDFLEGTAELRRIINAAGGKKWLLYSEDCWYFFLAITALLQCRKEILLSANVSPAYIAEIRGITHDGGASDGGAPDGGAPDGAVLFLTDMVFSEGERPPNTFHIPSLLKEVQKTDRLEEKAPAINADETSIILYTSGSTGKPKAIQQRLTEMEADNRFAISQWGDEYLKRKACSTVSHHHIYSLLWAMLLPFTLGVPFRRRRIEFPYEMEKLSDTEYIIITAPAFLKRAAEMESSSGFFLKSPWIFSAGAVLAPEAAQKISEVFGFWPVEVYGSTETSGIAWRQSANGPEWTVFDNAQISQNRDGCLIIRSPYIKDPAGYETADMVDILEDGRFLLKGRLDSMVKIEGKRISLTEIEDRILQSGLASDVCVISMEDKRQYLAAAIVFNNKGKERFNGLEKHEINKFWREHLLKYLDNIVIPKKWRYPEQLPLDAQGKKIKENIRILFSGEPGTEERIIQKTETSVSLEFSIPDTSPYFDGHFPGFPILPAVAQVELALRFASKYFGTSIGVSEIRKIKFSNLIRPFNPLVLTIDKKEKNISFKINSPSGETVYSRGTMVSMGDL